MSGTTTVVLAGMHGHGRWHLRELRRLRGAGARLVGICDPRPPEDADDDLAGTSRCCRASGTCSTGSGRT